MTPDSDSQKTEQLSAYLDGQLDRDQSAQVEQQLGQDSQLKAHLDAWRDIGDQIKQLPQFALPENFADQVLAKLDPPHSDAAVSPGVVSGGAPSDTGSVWALGVIATLAAMLLLVLSVAPPAISDSIASGPDPSEEVVSGDPNKQNSSAMNSSDTVAQPGNRREMIRQPLAMRMRNGDQASGQVGSNKLALDQVLMVSFPEASENPVARVKEALRSSSNGGSIKLLPDTSATKDSSAIVVIARGDQLKLALESLSESGAVTIEAVALTAQKSTSDLESAATQSIATATTIPVTSISSPQQKNEIDAVEAKKLDEWFGISTLPGGTEFHRFLILVR